MDGGRWKADRGSETGSSLMNMSNDTDVREEDEEMQLCASWMRHLYWTTTLLPNSP